MKVNNNNKNQNQKILKIKYEINQVWINLTSRP